MDAEEEVRANGVPGEPRALLRLKKLRFSDPHLDRLAGAGGDEGKPGAGEERLRAELELAGVRPVFKRVDTCVAEFPSGTPYLYSCYCYEGDGFDPPENEAEPTDARKILILGPEMKSTGEVMGLDQDFGRAFEKAQLAAGGTLPESGRAVISVRDRDKPSAVELGRRLAATRGTARALRAEGLTAETINKVLEGPPHIVDALKDDRVDFMINITESARSITDNSRMRRTALLKNVPYAATIAGASAMIDAITAVRATGFDVPPLQSYGRGEKLPRSVRPHSASSLEARPLGRHARSCGLIVVTANTEERRRAPGIVAGDWATADSPP